MPTETSALLKQKAQEDTGLGSMRRSSIREEIRVAAAAGKDIRRSIILASKDHEPFVYTR